MSVLAFNINGVANGEPLKKAEELSAIIKESKADVVFISEDFDKINLALDSLLKVDYPFTTLTKTPADLWHYFYSKYPIVEYKRIKQNDYFYSFIYYADIKIENDTIRTFGCHMASNNYNPRNEYVRPEYINSYKKLREYLDDIGLATIQRCNETDSIVKYVLQGNKPTIVMGDMNDVCGSQPLNILKNAGLKDAWWTKGFGYGATIQKPIPYRIDHIFYYGSLAIEDVKLIDNKGLSDHDALYASFTIRSL